VRRVFIAFCFLLCTNAYAEWATPTAAEIANKCKYTENPKSKFALCDAVVKGYVDGYKRGVARGLRSGFIFDKKNLDTSRGIADTFARIAIVTPQATCLPEAATTEQIEIVLVNYVDLHPKRGNDPYPTVLSDAIEDYFCPVR